METFQLNGDLWQINHISPDDEMLIDRTGTRTVATTDPSTRTVYLSTALRGKFLITVFVHELSHCMMISYNLIEKIHDVVYPERWLDAEEWVCNWITDYGLQIFDILFNKLGYDAWRYIPLYMKFN